MFIPKGSCNIKQCTLFLRVYYHGQLQHKTRYPFLYVFITMGSYNIRQDTFFFTCSLPSAVATYFSYLFIAMGSCNSFIFHSFIPMGSCNMTRYLFLRVHHHGQLQHKIPFLRVHRYGQLQHTTRYPFLYVFITMGSCNIRQDTFFTFSLLWAVAT